MILPEEWQNISTFENVEFVSWAIEAQVIIINSKNIIMFLMARYFLLYVIKMFVWLFDIYPEQNLHFEFIILPILRLPYS
jgi:hypothetical protein